MPPGRIAPEPEGFNHDAELPYGLRLKDFELAMQDIYDLLADINTSLADRNLRRLEDTVRPAVFSGILSDTLAESLARHARALVVNREHNGHPDLIPEGLYALDRVHSGDEGVEVKVTKGRGGVDMHGARPAWVCLFRYAVDSETEPAVERQPTSIVEILLGKLDADDFRKNPRGELGTRTASPNRQGLAKLRANWVYRLAPD